VIAFAANSLSTVDAPTVKIHGAMFVAVSGLGPECETVPYRTRAKIPTPTNKHGSLQ
jgi:hypothetical protein